MAGRLAAWRDIYIQNPSAVNPAALASLLIGQFEFCFFCLDLRRPVK